MKLSYILTLLFVVLLAGGCKKEAGDGGTSSVIGKVLMRDYNGTFPFFYEQFPAVETDVYIVYGDDDNTYDDRTKCSYDGTFKFNYLRNGKYKVFVYSYDTLSKPGDIYTDTVFTRTVEISDRKSTVDAGTITIIKN